VATHVDSVVFHSEQCLEVYHQEKKKEPVCALVREYCRSGWPDKGSVRAEIVPYWRARGALTVCKQILLFAEWIIILKSLQKETLQKFMQTTRESSGAKLEWLHRCGGLASVNGWPKWCNNVLCVQGCHS